MVRAKLARRTERDVVTVKVELPEPLSNEGLKVALAPRGNPLRAKLTVSLKPPTELMPIMYVV